MSSVYLVSLVELMVLYFLILDWVFNILVQTTLHNCEPHFVRCLVPNTHKKPGEVESPLIIIITIVITIIIITTNITTILLTRWSHH